MSKPNASTILTEVILRALDAQFPGGAFPGGQILEAETVEGSAESDSGPEIRITFQTDAWEYPLTCLMQVVAD